MTSQDEARDALLEAIAVTAKKAQGHNGSSAAQMIAAAAYAYAIVVNEETPDAPFTIG